MPGERSRSLEIEGSDEPGLDARSIVLGGGCQEDAEAPPVDQPAGPSVVWEGQVLGEGTGRSKKQAETAAALVALKERRWKLSGGTAA